VFRLRALQRHGVVSLVGLAALATASWVDTAFAATWVRRQHESGVLERGGSRDEGQLALPARRY